MFPGEEFLPRAPDPEEIIFGEDENKDQESHQNVDSESTEVNPESTEVNPDEDLISKNESDIDVTLKSPESEN